MYANIGAPHFKWHLETILYALFARVARLAFFMPKMAAVLCHMRQFWRSPGMKFFDLAFWHFSGHFLRSGHFYYIKSFKHAETIK